MVVCLWSSSFKNVQKILFLVIELKILKLRCCYCQTTQLKVKNVKRKVDQDFLMRQ